MATRPPAPDSLPQYLADGVPKQNDENLHVLQDWIDDLLVYRQDVAAEDLDVDEGESIQAVEESSEGTVVIKKVSCGKDNCNVNVASCMVPTNTSFVGRGDSLDWDYRGPVTQ